MTHPTPSPPPRAVRDLRTDGRHAPAPDRGGRSRVEPAGCDGAFERAWLAELSHRTVGARLASVGRRDLRLQFVCTTPDRVLPWRVHVVDGTLVSVGAGFTLDPERAVNHSLALGLRLLGATGTGPIDVDDLCVDCWLGHGWVRHRVPPLDTPATAAVSGAGGRPLVWVERVHGAPVGEFFVVRELVDRHLTVRDVRRYTPEVDAQVRSRVRWAELLVMGRRGIVGWAAPRLEWRGSERDVWLVRDSVRAVQQSMDESAHDRRARYEVLGDAVGLLRDLGRVLRVEASHTGLW